VAIHRPEDLGLPVKLDRDGLSAVSPTFLMAARYTVYCRKSAANVTAVELLAGTRIADLHTIAEGEGIPEEAIVSALRQLRMENLGSSGFKFYRLCYRPDGNRQVDIERWQTIEEVRTVVEEVLEDLEATSHSVLPRIRSRLAETVDIVDASFGSSESERMAPVLVSEVVRWLAEQFDGIIRAADHSWWELGPKYHEYKPIG